MKDIVMDTNIRFGKPTIKGTRMTVEEVLEALAGGMDVAAIQQEYGLNKRQIQAALRYVSGWVKGETTSEYEIPARR